MDEFRTRYGPWALVAGASEGLGAAFATELAARGLNVVLVARRAKELGLLRERLVADYGVEVATLVLDLASPGLSDAIERETSGLEVGLLVCNAASSVIGPFLDEPLEKHLIELDLNCRAPLILAHQLGFAMSRRGRGGILLMSSLAGSQGAPFIATYAATKAFDRVLAEGLWGELRSQGVDVLACCAGATRTPRYLDSQPPGGGSSFVPEMEPSDVAAEALAQLGRGPRMIPGRGNRVASLLLRMLPLRTAIGMMGSQTRAMSGD